MTHKVKVVLEIDLEEDLDEKAADDLASDIESAIDILPLVINTTVLDWDEA